MPSFPLSSAGSVPGGGWRPLRKIDPKVAPLLAGWDVYDLQRKLNYVGGSTGDKITADGVFGKQTEAAVKNFQAQVSPMAGPIDGIAGARTQVVLAQYCCARSALPARVRGQMEKESSLLCGIYTATYSNASQDTGPLQMNTQYHPNLNENFDVKVAIRTLVGRIESYHDKYVAWGLTDKEAYRCAQGAWNSPVLADRLARGESVPQTFLDYVEAVTIYA